MGGPRGGGGDHGLVPDEGKNVRLVHEVNVYDMMMKNVMLVWVRVGRASAASEAASISREHGGWGATIKVIPPPSKNFIDPQGERSERSCVHQPRAWGVGK